MITKATVHEALKKVDNNILKLDTVDPGFISLVDRPNTPLKLDTIIEKMKEFNGSLVIQTMFLKGKAGDKVIDNTTDEYVLPWIETIKEIAPREVMIYTIDRETPLKGLQKATREELDSIVAKLNDEGIKASASY